MVELEPGSGNMHMQKNCKRGKTSEPAMGFQIVSPQFIAVVGDLLRVGCWVLCVLRTIE